jgi:hypothetical protein
MATGIGVRRPCALLVLHLFWCRIPLKKITQFHPQSRKQRTGFFLAL